MKFTHPFFPLLSLMVILLPEAVKIAVKRKSSKKDINHRDTSGIKLNNLRCRFGVNGVNAP